MKQYEYEFDRLGIDLVPFCGYRTEGHQELIRARAKNGWIYDGWIPTKQHADSITEIELIFRREIPEET